MTKLLAFYAGMWVNIHSYPTLHQCDLAAQRLIHDNHKINTVICGGPQGAVAYYAQPKTVTSKRPIGKYEDRGRHPVVPIRDHSNGHRGRH